VLGWVSAVNPGASQPSDEIVTSCLIFHNETMGNIGMWQRLYLNHIKPARDLLPQSSYDLQVLRSKVPIARLWSAIHIRMRGPKNHQLHSQLPPVNYNISVSSPLCTFFRLVVIWATQSR
jgi:hypothetical protein